MISFVKHQRLFCISLLWLLLVGVGFWKLFTYTNTPGISSKSLPKWPSSSHLVRREDRPTLILFAHPQCPCSKASVGELARLMPQLKDKVTIYTVFFKPKDQSESWVKSGLWEEAQAIPTVQAIVDQDGNEADRFGVRTSGQVLLFDTRGGLVFQGGITPGRGHMGDSEGRIAILSFIQTGHTKIEKTPVFGCSLKNPERASTRGKL